MNDPHDPSTRPLITVVEDDVENNRAVCGLARSHGWDAVGYEYGETFLDHYDGDRAGCIVLDLRLPDISGLQVASRLAERLSHVAPIVFMTGHGDLRTAVQAMKYDLVRDFVEKPFRPADLLSVIAEAVQYDVSTMASWRRNSRIRERLSRLSDREREVLSALMQGKSNKQIAMDLDISHKTISTHRTHVLAKFECQSIVDVARMLESSGDVVTIG